MKDNAKISAREVAYTMIIIALSIYFLVAAKAILIPLVFAMLFAFILKPICKYFESWTRNQVIPVLLTYLLVFGPILGVFFLFSRYFISIFQGVSTSQVQIQDALKRLIFWAQKNFSIAQNKSEEWIQEQLQVITDNVAGYLWQGISSTGAIITGVLLVLIYTFLMLLYRVAIKQFFLTQFSSEKQQNTLQVLLRTQVIIKKYFYGLGLVMLILGLMNSTGLWLIGIDYAFFWGFLAAILAVVPYIGTAVGGLLPFVYSLATTDTWWQPVMVIVLYWFVQTLEGNFITPKIVGSSVRINPLVAIISLFAGGLIWGIPGLILAIPLVAIIRIIFLQIDALKPIGLLLSSDLAEKGNLFRKRFDEERFRLASLFRPKQKK